MSSTPLDLNKLYGPNYQHSFDPYIRNIRIGLSTVLHRKHHCGKCKNGPIKARCFEKLHVAYCISADENENGNGIICGERFEVDSPGGCAKHPYNYGHNLLFKEAVRGKELSLEAKEGLNNGNRNIDLEESMKALTVEDKGYEYYNEQKKLSIWAVKSQAGGRSKTKITKKLQPALTYRQTKKTRR